MRNTLFHCLWASCFVITCGIVKVAGETHDRICDVQKWHTELLDYLDNVDLSGRKASFVRKIKQQIEDYDDKTMFKPCSILNKYKVFIVEETDDDDPSLRDININLEDNHDSIVKIAIASEKLAELNKSESKKTVSEEPIKKLPADNVHEELKEFLAEDSIARNERDNSYFEGEDPTDLSFLDEDGYYNGDYGDKYSSDGGDSYSHSNNKPPEAPVDENETKLYDQSENAKEDIQNVDKLVATNSSHGIQASKNIQSNEESDEHEMVRSETGVCARLSSCKYHYYLNVQIPRINNANKMIASNRKDQIRLDVHSDTVREAEYNISNRDSVITTLNGDNEEMHQPVEPEDNQITESKDKDNAEPKSNEIDSDSLSEDDKDNTIKEHNKPNSQDVQESLTKVDSTISTTRGKDDTKNNENGSGGKSDENNSDEINQNANEISGEPKENTESKERGKYQGASENKYRDHLAGQDIVDSREHSNRGKGVNKDNGLKNEEIFLNRPKPDPEVLLLMAQSELQYAKKFEKLELDLVKLENKVLTQKVDKKIEAGSMNHLENHILRLENNLLKLNQSYTQLQREHNSLKRKQKIQNSSMKLMFYNNNKAKTCPNTEVATKVNIERIAEQKAQIWELSQIVANQSINMNQVQKRSEVLEEQNRQLFKMMMDQSALITQVVSQLNEMNTNNVKTNLETKELKLLVDNTLSTFARIEEISRTNAQNTRDQNPGESNTPTLPQIKPYAILKDENERKEEKESVDNDHTPNEIKTEEEIRGSDNKRRGVSGTDARNIENEEVLSKQNAHEKEDEKQKQGIQVKERKKSSPETDRPTPPTQDSNKTQNDSKPSTRDSGQPNSSNTKQDVSNGKIKHQQVKKPKEKNHEILYKQQTQGVSVDCQDIYKLNKGGTGVNKIYLVGFKMSVNVFCDEMASKDGGWTVILQRSEGSEDFYQDFGKYKEGFGSLGSDHYIGNEAVHFLTNQKHYTLKVELTDWEGNTRYATYDHFWVDSESNNFKLHIGGYSGTAGDGLSKHNNMGFSTFDVDNDLVVKEFGGSCAKRFHGAGWYYKCYQSNLMGVYYKNGLIPEKKFDGITWKPWKGANYSLKSVKMSVRPKEGS